MASIIRQFALLAWKNWLLTKRRPIVSIFELLMPLLMPTVMLVLRPFVSATVTDTPTHHEPFAVRRMPTTLLPPLMRFPDIEAPAGTPRNVWLIAYAPNNHITEKLINRTLLSVNTIYFPSMNDSVPFYAAQGKTAGRRLLNSTTYAFTHIYISVGERPKGGHWVNGVSIVHTPLTVVHPRVQAPGFTVHVTDAQGVFASEMIYIVSGGALNSTHSLARLVIDTHTEKYL